MRQDAPNTSVIITGLSTNAYYDFQVRALNTDGSGPWSSTAEGATSPRPETVFANHPLIPDDLGVGDSFRLLFVTGTADNVLGLMPLKAATSTGNHDYTNLVLDPALHIVESGNFMNRWGEVFLRQTALVSLPGADARLLTDTTWTATDRGVPIYWLNGARVADDYADFYDGSWENEDKPRNGLGNPAVPARRHRPLDRHRPRRHGAVRRRRVPGHGPGHRRRRGPRFERRRRRTAQRPRRLRQQRRAPPVRVVARHGRRREPPPAQTTSMYSGAPQTEATTTRAAVRAQLFTTGPESLRLQPSADILIDRVPMSMRNSWAPSPSIPRTRTATRTWRTGSTPRSSWSAPMALPGKLSSPRWDGPRAHDDLRPGVSGGVGVPTPRYGPRTPMARMGRMKAGVWPTLSSTGAGPAGSRTRPAGRCG